MTTDKVAPKMEGCTFHAGSEADPKHCRWCGTELLGEQLYAIVGAAPSTNAAGIPEIITAGTSLANLEADAAEIRRRNDTPVPAAPDEKMPETPNLDAALQGCVSGHISEWPKIREEIATLRAYATTRDEEAKRMRHRAEIAERQMHLEHEYYEKELARSDRLQRKLDELKSESGFAKAIVDNKMKDELEVVRSGRDLMAAAVKALSGALDRLHDVAQGKAEEMDYAEIAFVINQAIEQHAEAIALSKLMKDSH